MAKARTKSQKRGRKKVPNVPREPNGRISRSGIPHEPADVVALTARMRHTGLPATKAKDQKAASYIGYLNLLGPRDGLSDTQYNGLAQLLDLRAKNLRAIKAPDSTQRAEGSTTGDEVSDAYIEWCKSVIRAYEDCRRAIQEAQFEHREENLWAAYDICVLRDEWHSHMVPALRYLGNATARHFRT